ncbi:MAG: hypothetical protein EBT81_00790 [Gammaproteobacteria bacterium]|nr:hypothetical protein [Gammaproteobacteria bacterium]NDA44286.1 hypothetical protein [Gammaproteobacteria bacterium]
MLVVEEQADRLTRMQDHGVEAAAGQSVCGATAHLREVGGVRAGKFLMRHRRLSVGGAAPDFRRRPWKLYCRSSARVVPSG